MASKTSFEALPIGNAPCGRGAKAEQEIALSNENRFPSGATIDQVKKDAKKLAKAQGIPLNKAQDASALKHGLALPWNRVNEWLAGQSRSAIASFTLPLDNGETKTVNLTSEQPLVIVYGWVGCGKSTTALVLAGQAMATSNASLFFLTSKPVGWPPAVWDSLYRDFPDRCFEVGDVHNLDLAQINPKAGDIVILDERYQVQIYERFPMKDIDKSPDQASGDLEEGMKRILAAVTEYGPALCRGYEGVPETAENIQSAFAEHGFSLSLGQAEEVYAFYSQSKWASWCGMQIKFHPNPKNREKRRALSYS